MRFEEICKDWMEKKKNDVKTTSMAAYKLIVNKYLIPYFKETEDITDNYVQEFVDCNLERGLSVKSVHDSLVVLRMVLKHGKRLGIIETTNFEVKLPRQISQQDLPVFTVNQQKIFIDYLTTHINIRNMGLLLCLNTGMRIGEICALKWDDIDTKQGFVNINKTLYRIYLGNKEDKKTELILSTPKTLHSYRSIPICKELLKGIRKLKPRASSGLFFLSTSEKPIEPRTYREYYRKVLRQLKLPALKFHGMRHSFATRCIENECDYKTVSAILGHSDITTTLNMYVHPTAEQKRKCIEKMIRGMEGNDPTPALP